MIDVEALDSNFDLIGVDVGFTGDTELRVISTASGWMIEGDINGNEVADFAIAVIDPTHTIVWDDTDFGLV